MILWGRGCLGGWWRRLIRRGILRMLSGMWGGGGSWGGVVRCYALRCDVDAVRCFVLRAWETGGITPPLPRPQNSMSTVWTYRPSHFCPTTSTLSSNNFQSTHNPGLGRIFCLQTALSFYCFFHRKGGSSLHCVARGRPVWYYVCVFLRCVFVIIFPFFLELSLSRDKPWG